MRAMLDPLDISMRDPAVPWVRRLPWGWAQSHLGTRGGAPSLGFVGSVKPVRVNLEFVPVERARGEGRWGMGWMGVPKVSGEAHLGET